MVEIVCHGLQSRLESQLAESRIHSLRSPSPKPQTLHQPTDIAFNSCFLEPNTKPHCEENSYKSNTIHHSNPNNQGGWNFLQALSNVSKDKETTTTTTTYVHPQVRYSSVRLSPKSLEFCTENLGNETGTDDTMDEFDLLSSSWTREQRKSSQVLRAEKVKTKNFPPPLTTIRGGTEPLKMRPHREDGRLVIEVTKVPSSDSCFQAERSHGRLRLSLLKKLTEEDDDDEDDNEEVENEMNGLGKIEGVEAEEETEEEESVEEGIENNEDEEACGIRIMEKYDWGRRSKSRCKGVDQENKGYGFDAVKFFHHFEILFFLKFNNLRFKVQTLPPLEFDEYFQSEHL